MDDYVSKPVTPESLEAALRRWVGAPAAPAEKAATASPAAGDRLDETIVASLMSVDDDGTLMDEVVATFIRIAPVRLASIRKAAKGNPAQLERAAHSFLGSCGNLGCRRMADLCARLEVLAAPGRRKRSGARGCLEEEYAAVKPTSRPCPRATPSGPAPPLRVVIRDALRTILGALFRVLFTYDSAGEEKVPSSGGPSSPPTTPRTSTRSCCRCR